MNRPPAIRNKVGLRGAPGVLMTRKSYCSMLDLSKATRRPLQKTLPKVPTGISGLDEVLQGGLPRGRPTLVCGSAGSGKTLFAMEFLVRGAIEFDEPGVFISFEESNEELTTNVA